MLLREVLIMIEKQLKIISDCYAELKKKDHPEDQDSLKLMATSIDDMQSKLSLYKKLES